MKKLITILIILVSLQSQAQRNTAIEIRIDTNNVPSEIMAKYDIQYSTAEKEFILWVSDYKPFNKELLQYLGNVKSVYNRVTKTDHLNLYYETDKQEQYGLEVYANNGVRYFHNIRWSEIGTIDFQNTAIYTQKEIYELNNLYQ